VIELQAALAPPPGDVGRDVNEQAFLFVLAEEQPNLPGSSAMLAPRRFPPVTGCR
jgi:hypothetical protein